MPSPACRGGGGADGGSGGAGGGDGGGGEGAATVLVVITGSATLSTVVPTASPRAVALLASDCTESNTLVSFAVIVATTLTEAALTASEMASGATPIEVARARSSCGNQFAATCVMQPSSSGVETEITAVPPSIQPKELGWGWLAKQRMPAPVARATAPPTTAQRRPFGRVRSQTAGMMNGMYPR